MARKQAITIEDGLKIEELFNKGMKTPMIAAVLNLPYKPVLRYLTINGFRDKIKKPIKPDEAMMKYIEKNSDGMTAKQMAEVLGCDKSTVNKYRKHLREQGRLALSPKHKLTVDRKELRKEIQLFAYKQGLDVQAVKDWSDSLFLAEDNFHRCWSCGNAANPCVCSWVDEGKVPEGCITKKKPDIKEIQHFKDGSTKRIAIPVFDIISCPLYECDTKRKIDRLYNDEDFQKYFVSAAQLVKGGKL